MAVTTPPAVRVRGALAAAWSLVRRRPGRFALALFAVALLCFCLSIDGTLASKLPSHLLLDRADRFLGEVPGSDDAYGYWPLPAQLPEKMVITTLETEDRHFYEHGGVHVKSIARAAWQNTRNRRIISGASTLSMQVARLQHPKSRTLWAKSREAVEALLLVRRYGHDRVLRQYLTLAPYGTRCRGIVRAARLYFDKPVEDLSWLQAAYLAALPQQPGRMSPWTEEGHARALKRARRILRQLHQRGLVNDNDLHVALHSDLQLCPKPARHPEAMHAVLAWSRLLRGPEVIHRATLDLEIQRIASQALQRTLKSWEPAGVGNTAGLVVDTESGEILAYVGSADYFDEGRHGALDYLEVRRSPGSALKPFLYAMALERRTHTAATELPDTPMDFAVPGGGLYVPENIGHDYLGPMLFRQALGNSRNIPALRVLSDVGVDRAVELLERGGVKGVSYSPEAYGLTLALGALHVTPLELAELYTALARQGETIPLRRFVDEPRRPSARLFSRDAAMLIAHILADPEARRPGFPAGGPLDFDFATAVKTGTSQGYRDAWTAAFTDRLLVVGWVGNHDWRRMNQVSGAVVVAPAVHRILEEVMPLRSRHRPYALSFPLPENAVSRDVCSLSGRIPGKGCTHVKTEYFIPGTEPTKYCPFHVDVAIDVRNGLRARETCPARFVVKRPMLALPELYAPWARQRRLAIAPVASSPLCPSPESDDTRVAIREPRASSRYLYDPDTPREYAAVRFSASVAPATEEIVWLVDGVPVATVGYPHEIRWPLPPGRHTIRAAMVRRPVSSAPVVVVVDD